MRTCAHLIPAAGTGSTRNISLAVDLCANLIEVGQVCGSDLVSHFSQFAPYVPFKLISSTYDETWVKCNPPSSGSNVGAIVGAVIGVLLGVGLVVGGYLYYTKSYLPRKKASAGEELSDPILDAGDNPNEGYAQLGAPTGAVVASPAYEAPSHDPYAAHP